MGVDHCVNDAYVKQWKYVPLNPKGPHPIPMWQEMHTDEAVVSLDHDQVSDLVRKVHDLINGFIMPFTHSSFK